MKKIYALFLFISVSMAAYSQCSLLYNTTPCSCFGSCDGTATATPSGGTPPFTFSWNTTPSQSTQTATGLCAGNYNCMVVDALGNTCASTGMGNVTQPFSVGATTTGNNPTSCTICNGTASGNASGGTFPYTYAWTTTPVQTASTATGLCSGVFTVTITDANGCTATATQILTAPGAPNFTISVVSATQPNCNNGTATATVSNPGTYIYSWTTTPTQTTLTATGLSSGVYTVCVTNSANGCSSCQGVTVNCLTGIEENNTNGNISVYPNPSSGNFTITSITEITSIKIYNVLGEFVFSSQPQTTNYELDLQNKSKGVYFLEMQSDKGSEIKKIIIE